MKITHTLTAAAIAGLLSIGSFAGAAMAQDVDGAADVRAQIEALNCDSLLDADVRGRIVTSIDDLIRDGVPGTTELTDALALRGLLAVKISALETQCDEEPAPTTVVVPPATTTTSPAPSDDEPQVERVPRGGVETGGR